MDESKQYGKNVNRDLLRFIGSLRGSVIDIGCGAGVWGDSLREIGAASVVGVEPDESSAAQAGLQYDEVHCVPLASLPEGLIARADVVVLADVLEHLYDPWAALKQVRSQSHSSTVLYVSVPNLRYYRILFRLAGGGRFNYVSTGGIMDEGHIRWFTTRTLEAALAEAGWKVLRTGGSLFPKDAQLNRMTLGVISRFLYHQIFIEAVPDTEGQEVESTSGR